jgi:hypothetical protein
VENPCNDCITFALCKARYDQYVKKVRLPCSVALTQMSIKCVNLLWYLNYQLTQTRQLSQIPVNNPLTKRKVIFLTMDKSDISKAVKRRAREDETGIVW